MVALSILNKNYQYRWFRRPKKVDNLVLAAAHMHQLPRLTRAVVAEEICSLAVLPLLRSYLDIEESHTHAVVSPVSTKSAASGQEVGCDIPYLFFSLLSGFVFQLLSVMSEVSSAKELMRTVIDLLSYLLDHTDPADIDSTSDKADGERRTLRPVLVRGSPAHAAPPTGGANLTDQNNKKSQGDKDSSQTGADVWPPLTDAKITALSKRFRSRGGVSASLVEAHIALMCVLQLRAECGLRGIRPSQLIGADILSSLCTTGVISSTNAVIDMVHSNSVTINPTAKSSGTSGPNGSGSAAASADGKGGPLKAVRTEFILQCFHRLGATPSTVIYRLAGLWGCSINEIRIMHISSLLDLCLDDLVDEMIPQVVNYAC